MSLSIFLFPVSWFFTAPHGYGYGFLAVNNGLIATITIQERQIGSLGFFLANQLHKMFRWLLRSDFNAPQFPAFCGVQRVKRRKFVTARSAKDFSNHMSMCKICLRQTGVNGGYNFSLG
jgi:hypothetical protein